MPPRHSLVRHSLETSASARRVRSSVTVVMEAAEVAGADAAEAEVAGGMMDEALMRREQQLHRTPSLPSRP